MDGLFPHRDELAEVRDLSIFLQVPFRVSVARMAARDGSSSDPDDPALAHCARGQRLYFEARKPWQRASLVIDNVELDAPTLVSAR